MWTEVTGNSEYVIWLCTILHVCVCLVRERFSQNSAFLKPKPAYRPPGIFPPILRLVRHLVKQMGLQGSYEAGG
jgi:hypothetical protein